MEWYSITVFFDAGEVAFFMDGINKGNALERLIDWLKSNYTGAFGNFQGFRFSNEVEDGNHTAE
jgi:hypothetical protein